MPHLSPEAGVLCDECFSGIKIHETLFCARCRNRLPHNKKVCHKDSPYLLGAAADYADRTVRELIHNLKFKSVKDAAEPLARILGEYVSSLGIEFKNFLVVPLPLSKVRERERGFNQSELIAKIFAEKMDLPISTNLVRTRNTSPQSEIRDLGARRKNVENCFAVRSPSKFEKQNIILVDDVTTSGATLDEAVRAVKDCGVKRILALAVAKA